MRFSSRSPRTLSVHSAQYLLPLALLALTLRSAHAQMPSIPSAPSIPTAPAVPTGVTDAQTDAEQAKQAAQAAKQAKKELTPAERNSEAAKAGSVGATLNDLLNQVSAAVNKAAAANNIAALEAGRDLTIAISSTQNVYEDDLGKQMDGKVSPALKSTLDQLVDAILQLNTMSNTSLQVASTDAEQVTNSLPYRPGEPKIVKMTPRFLVPSGKESYVVKIHFTGKFDMGTKPEYFASLMMHDHAYKPVASSATDVEFGVPITDLYPLRSRSAKLQVMPGTLKVPWQSSSLMGKKHTKKEDDFKLVVMALPSGPGVVKFMAKATRMEKGAPQLHIGQQFYQCSGRSCGKPDDINHMWTEAPSPNCVVVPGSSTFEAGKVIGDYKKEFLGDAGEGVSYSVTTERKGNATESVSFTINFQETCMKEVPNTTGDTLDLAWGDSKTVKVPPDSQWKVSLDAFDGTHTDFGVTPVPSGLLKVTPAGDSVTISAPAPAAVVWP